MQHQHNQQAHIQSLYALVLWHEVFQLASLLQNVDLSADMYRV